ncbi:glucan endo-1,3-beta-glucosidase 1-like [Papaver somniferum]|nr:glucan endo-1,3-beta-glucosidase 1-like [Papaver somniferum]
MRNFGGFHCWGRVWLQVLLAMALVSISVSNNVGSVCGHPNLSNSPHPPYDYSSPPPSVNSSPPSYYHTSPNIQLSGFVLARHTNEDPTFCIARTSADESKLQEALDWVCSHGVDCSPLLEGKPCHDPDTVAAHASYAFNSYYYLSGKLTGTCDFRGLGNITRTNPSHGACIFSDRFGFESPNSSGFKYSKLGAAGALLLILVTWVLSN